MHSLDLNSHDRSVIKEGGGLSDKHMHTAHKLLRKQFPLMNGLQSTLLCQTRGFAPVSSNGRFEYLSTTNNAKYTYSSFPSSYPDTFHNT